MVQAICDGLSRQYPRYADTFQTNLASLLSDLDKLQQYGQAKLADLSCRELITFHDGFSYLAQAFDLTILEAIEEESGSEASAKELKEMITLVREHRLPAVFTEVSGSASAADIIGAETGAKVFSLDMAMAGEDYFEAMYRNIDTIREALK
jgi:ABC-type Zn uptake system ZnuABC Zn-binding protein ZnuA